VERRECFHQARFTCMPLHGHRLSWAQLRLLKNKAKDQRAICVSEVLFGLRAAQYCIPKED